LGDEDAVSATASTSAAGAAPAAMPLDQAKRKIKEDLKELFMLRQLGEAEGYFSALPTALRWYLVEELVHRAVDARAADVQLISDVFDLVASKSLVDEAQFSRGFASDMEYLEDTSTDSPNAYGNVASLLKASKLSQEAVERYNCCQLYRNQTNIVAG
jgi:translation initiation factor 4G